MAHQVQYAKTPDELVNPQVLPYIHLVSNFHYPIKNRLDTKEVIKLLRDAPGIVKNKAPFHWTRLERPPNGTILLIWARDPHFAADGFAWTGNELPYRDDLGDGTQLELYLAPAGFGPGETYAMQSRRRFRLVLGPPQAKHNVPPFDPCLWLVHWVPADKDHCIPVQPVPQEAPVFQGLRMLGTLPMKKFMLGDESNWPLIGPPPNMQGPPRLTGPPVPQRMAYPPGPRGVVPPPGTSALPPNRLSRPSLSGHPGHPGHPGPHHQAVLKDSDIDEEENHTGDFFDVMTPRDLAIERFKMNHEWMEEILASPYALNSIIPPDLGLGLAGELSKLTEGIFETPDTSGVKSPEDIDRVATAKKPYIGKLDPGLADEFRKRVQKHLDDTKAEMDEKRKQHEKIMAELKASSLLVEAEKALRDPNTDIDAIAAKVQSYMGFRAENMELVNRVQDGGYEATIPDAITSLMPEAPEGPAADPNSVVPSVGLSRDASQASSHQSSTGGDNDDVDMDDTAAGLLDQIGRTASPIMAASNNFPTPQHPVSGLHSALGTPAHTNAPSPLPPPVVKAGTPYTTPDQGTGTGDWIVVPKGGDVTPDPNNSNSTNINNPPPVATPAPALGTPAPTQPVTAAPGGSLLSFDAENADFGSLGDLNSAGDALAGFGGDLDMEDTAFGDAFHASALENPVADDHVSDM